MTHPNYNLALRLKESGFPQNVLYDELLYGPEVTQEQAALIDHGIAVEGVETVIWPSTDALIEELGEDFMEVGRTLNVVAGEFNSWEAVQKTWCCDEHGESRKYTYGFTPKEALINLYLALHENI